MTGGLQRSATPNQTEDSGSSRAIIGIGTVAGEFGNNYSAKPTT